MIYIADKPRNSIGAFTHKFRLISELVVGGPQWLRFALHSLTDSYMVRTEAELLALMQEGLHASDQMVLTNLNLQVDPLKLWSLPEEDLALIGTARKEENIEDILARHGLADFDKLHHGIIFLENHGLEHSPPFQVMNLSDRLALMDLARRTSIENPTGVTASWIKEGCHFAAQFSQNAREFVDTHNFYHAVLDKYPAKTKKTRYKRVQVVWEDYNDLCDSLMETFTLGKGYDSRDLSMEIKNALASLQQIGFSNKPAAMNNLMRHTDLKCQDQPHARKIARDYMTAAANLISTGKVEIMEYFQDGNIRLVFISAFTGSGGRALVDIDRLGVVTLASATVEKLL